MRERRSFNAAAAVANLVTSLARADRGGIAGGQRVGTALGWLAVGIAFAVAVVGIGGPFPEGHYASSAAIGTGASNMWRWHTIYPIAKLRRSRGRHRRTTTCTTRWACSGRSRCSASCSTFSNWVLRLPPLIYVTATTWLLWRLGRELWGAIPGGLTALAYVALPITLGYANYHDLEQPVMFGCVLSTWGYVRLVRTWRERYALASVLGFVFALNHDWPAYMWGAFFLAGLFVYGFLLPEPDGGGRCGRFRSAATGPRCASATAFSVALELYLLKDSGRISDVMASYFVRSAGSEAPLDALLAARHYRITLMFTGLAIAIGKLSLPVVAIRAIVKRDHFELLPLPLFLCALLQYTSFKQGADVHIFWPHYFAPYFALASARIAASIAELGRGWASRSAAARCASRSSGSRPGRRWSPSGCRWRSS